ncbi:putative metalloprotease CJM1_0395 family protein [uncultured Amphritea sp.]|uniref:putative metalloprotease CJM1_0395 family protein n=1 Tax=uncultured Amphritea sp. TaxID=981605 RepID=UPI00260BD207|nr:putative metalloprotease CJM1_0395 family protein [uncultured Amphritea sp.]
MQLSLAANSLALNTYQSSYTAGKNQPAVSGVSLPSSLSTGSSATPSITTTVTLQNSSIKPVDAPAAGVSAESYTDEQKLNRDASNDSSATGSQNTAPRNTEAQSQDLQSNEQQMLQELSARDREVRQHELSHAAAGGQYAGAPTFEYQRGPDGRLYAVGGEVSIDTSPVPNDPQATLEKATVILRAALVVAEPSPQDRAVAARAAAMAAEARADIAQQNQVSESGNGSLQEADKLRQERRSEELQNRIKDQQEQSDGQAEKMQDFNKQLAEVNQKLAEINQRLIDAGVFKKLFSEGFLFDERA